MNIQKMMKQAQQMQAKMQEMQEEMESKEFEGSAGGDMVKVTLTGKGALNGLAIDPSLIDPEDPDMLIDLIIAAHADAKKKADEGMADAMSDLTGGIQLPPGMKMPF
ncbi:MAG: YbaB/EbfC family nucleoid-associated protein [Rickettsiales bacterium]|nr:YbaB/EbfC family nucleoid-associated protein [Rickettsiales bacterium]